MTGTYSHRWKNLLEQLEKGLLLITASNRQADFLRQQYRYFRQDGEQPDKVWYKPAILTERQWTQTLFQHLLFNQDDSQTPAILLSELQTKLLWEKAVETEGDYLLDNKKTAERACQAARNLHQWLLSETIDTDESYNWRKETSRFKYWHQLVEQQCKQNNWLLPYKLHHYLSEQLTQTSNNIKSDILPEKIGLLGFQQLSPAMQRFIDTLRTMGVDFISLQPEPEVKEIKRLECANTNEEILQSAIWARRQWQQEPEQRIGIIIPNLNEKKSLVQHTFDQVFCSDRLLSSDDSALRPFDISLGCSLTSYPLIDSALMLMALTTTPLSQHEVIQFIQSPFLVSNDQLELINHFIVWLRRSRQATFKAPELKFIATSVVSEESELMHLFAAVDDFNAKGKVTPSQWAKRWQELLETVAWARKRQMSSVEYQTREAWNKKLEQMAIFDQLLGEINWSSFRKLFKRIIGETLFQPKTADIPIQVMGILEAVSLTFDQLRVCGLDNRLWPARANPNPFLPFDLQKNHQMPNATAERELEISEQLLATLEGSAKQIFFSHPKMDGEQVLSVSPLLEKFKLANPESDADFASPAKMINQAQKIIEMLDDEQAPVMKQAQVKGGSKLLQDIAKCQFRAFAHHRLYATAADEAREGIDPLDRGNLVHNIMEHCWLDLFNNQQHLLEKLHTQGVLEQAIIPYVQKALEQLQQERTTPLSKAIIELENKRLNTLILEWLKVELKREKFTVVGNEKIVIAPIAEHSIRLQIDRIDKLDDGSLAIVDYKTGKVDRNNWFGDRPEEPQLPLYATVLSNEDTAIGALLYGQVKTGDCKYTGVAENKDSISGISKSFADETRLDTKADSLSGQIDVWRNDLANLLEEYVHGYAAVSPTNDKVCSYCDLHGLCRIGEMSQRQGEQP